MARATSIGALSGLIAAGVSSIPGLLFLIATAQPWWEPVQLIATVVGFESRDSFEPVFFLVGGAIHILLSIGYAVAFTLASQRLDGVRMIAAGVAFGAAIYLVNFELAGAIGLFDELRSQTNPWVEFLAHAIFGATVALVLLATGRRVR